jgi:hypothetical protein
MKRKIALMMALLSQLVFAAPQDDVPQPAPATDRVGFPKGYAEQFEVLRIVKKPTEHKIVTVYGNKQAASITNAQQLPYPYGSILVMESATATQNPQAKPSIDGKGGLKGAVTGLHVMRREQGFGESYGKNRAGEWEYVEYKPDGSYITPPQKSAACAECHVKAGIQKDFVYQGRLASEPKR